MKLSLMVVILTYNESIHIERAIKNVSGWADKVVILDSYSEDDTTEKAKLLNVEVKQRKFDNYKNQREYAIEYARDKAEWLFFLDADEYLTEELKAEVTEAIRRPGIAGYYISIRFIFMNKWIKWGGYYPTYLLRLFRPDQASVDRMINEHVTVLGDKAYLKYNFIDHNLKGIGNWVDKHNRYATYEAIDLLAFKKKPKEMRVASKKIGKWLRYRVWNKLPIITVGVRPMIYFIYRYFLRLGFLDGKEGFVYHFLQGFWFWFLIDLKYLELKKNKCVE